MLLTFFAEAYKNPKIYMATKKRTSNRKAILSETCNDRGISLSMFADTLE